MDGSLLAEMLYTHECVIVPGLGGFLVNYHSAAIVPGFNRFSPPSGQVAFNAGLAGNDGLLANQLANTRNISYRQALEEISEWTAASWDSLRLGKKLEIEQVGTLKLNREGNIEFEPVPGVNFMENSFGLITFESKSVQFRQPFTTSEDKSVDRGKARHLILESVKWAAVLAPFVALTFWGASNRSMISNLVRQDASVITWSLPTQGKSISTPSGPALQETTATEGIPGMYLDEKSQDNLAMYRATCSSIAYSACHSINPVQQETLQTAGTKTYYVIGGAFREYGNALKLIGTLKTDGIEASVIGTNERGLYMVGMRGSRNVSDAAAELVRMRSAGYRGAWIWRKNS